MSVRTSTLLLLSCLSLAACASDPERTSGLSPFLDRALFGPFMDTSACAAVSDPQGGTDPQRGTDGVWHRGPARPLRARKDGGPEPQTRVRYKRLDQLVLPLNNVPALTLANEQNGVMIVNVAGETREDWALGLCAESQGESEASAKKQADEVSMTRAGDAMILKAPWLAIGDQETMGTLNIKAPASAPLFALGSVRVRDMTGPLFVSAPAYGGIATLIDTSGTVTASGASLNFAGSKGIVTLAGNQEINLKITAERFQGTIHARSVGPLHVYIPREFKTAFVVLVTPKKPSLTCHADICSKLTQAGNAFTYLGDGLNGPNDLHFVSDKEIIIENTN